MVVKVNRRITQALIVISVIMAMSCLYYYFADQGVEQMNTHDFSVDASYPLNKIIRYSFLVKNTSNQFVESAEFKAYAPVKQTASQYVKSIKTNSNYTMAIDPLANQVMTFPIKNLAPYGSKVITITAEMGLSRVPNTTNEYNIDDYLQDEPFIESNNRDIRDLGERLANTDKKMVTEAVYDWVSSHLNYAGYIRNDRGALYALEQGKGDCTEYMYLAAALLRTIGVPTRGIAGFVVSTNSVLNSADYHNWAEYYQEDSWHLLDAQKKVFDSQYENYIAFRIFGKQGQNALSQSQRFLAYDQRLEVRMN